MPRAPFNVLVFPYRQVKPGVYEYAIFQRADNGYWQGVAGGGEDDEVPVATAQREVWEETGIPVGTPLLQLDTVEPIRVTDFGVSYLWGEDLYVIPQYCFGLQGDGLEIRLSHEHTRYEWLRFEEAEARLHYHGNQTALWELNQRLKGGGPRG